MKTRLICFMLMLTTIVARAASDPTFTQANQEYAAGHFDKAISGYEQLARSGKWSANLFYNLGNAFYRAGDFGKAILNYERALALEPHHPEADANLRLARDQARALELRATPAERYFRFATEKQFTIAAAVAFWTAAFALAAQLLSRRRSAARIAVLVCGFVICIASAVGAYVDENGRNGRGLAIVTGKDVQARVATAENSGNVLTLPAGSEIKLLSARGDWLYVGLPNDQRGWIPANAAELVRL